MRAMVDMATYNADRRAVDAVADLCGVDQGSCPWMVNMVLNSGTARQHPIVTAYDVVERYPNLRKLVLPWIEERTTKYPLVATRFARELLRREKAGHPIDGSDAVISGLSPAAKEVIVQAVEQERTIEERQRGKE